MFRIIKKWYFKIYHLFKLLGIFILIFGLKEKVYAEEYKTCFDKYKIGNVTITDYQTNFKRIRPSLIVEPNNTYYIRFFSNEKYTCDGENTCFGLPGLGWDKDSKSIELYGIEINFDKENQIIELKIPNIENIYYYGLIIYSYRTNYTVLNNATMIMSKNREDILTCSTTPEEPTPEETNIYSNFLTLYTDRITYLAEGFTNNPYLLAMIGIIFSFIVLEITLKLFHMRGGK